ncbi:hypothetical protein C8R45DRAFT_946085 [Mycena sanguinolenta]|nr:hypothetical protein C8R45DRAFT_946085 [Mycena sanguinolenta]
MTRLDLPAPLAPHSPPQLHPLRFSGAPGLPRRAEVSNAHPIHVQSHCAASHVLLLRDNYSSFRQASPAQARGRKHASGHDEESPAHTRTRDTNAPPTPPSTTMETQDDETQRGEQARGDALLRISASLSTREKHGTRARKHEDETKNKQALAPRASTFCGSKVKAERKRKKGRSEENRSKGDGRNRRNEAGLTYYKLRVAAISTSEIEVVCAEVQETTTSTKRQSQVNQRRSALHHN